jgi:hypothetical protein
MPKKSSERVSEYPHKIMELEDDSRGLTRLAKIVFTCYRIVNIFGLNYIKYDQRHNYILENKRIKGVGELIKRYKKYYVINFISTNYKRFNSIG